MGFYFTTGQAAGELNVSSQTIRNLCASGQIKAERSAGGHFRIPPPELERLKSLESLPAAARATISAPGSRLGKRNPHELLAPPSVDVIESAEDAFVSDRQLATDTNQLQRLRVRKESLELSDYFEDRQQRRLAQEIEQKRREAEITGRQRQQQEAELAAEERKRFNLEWFAHALTTYKPANAPADYALLIQEDLFSTLNKLDSTSSESVVEACVNASIARSLQPLRAAEERSQAKRAAIIRAISDLPVRMQWDDHWLAKAHRVTCDAADSAREDASVEDMLAMANLALYPLILEHQHQQKIQDASESVFLPNATYQDREDAQEAIKTVLSALPVGSSDRQIAQAKEKELDTIRDRIEAVRRQERVENERQSRLATEEQLVQAGLHEIYWYSRIMLARFEYGPDETVFQIEQRVRPEVEKTLRREVSGDEDRETVNRRVHEIMEELEGCD